MTILKRMMLEKEHEIKNSMFFSLYRLLNLYVHSIDGALVKGKNRVE